MTDRHAHDRRHRRKREIEREAGAVRMPIVPFTPEMLAEISFQAEILMKALQTPSASAATALSTLRGLSTPQVVCQPTR